MSAITGPGRTTTFTHDAARRPIGATGPNHSTVADICDAAGSALRAVTLLIALFVTAWPATDCRPVVGGRFVLCIPARGAVLAVVVGDINVPPAAVRVAWEETP